MKRLYVVLVMMLMAASFAIAQNGIPRSGGGYSITVIDEHPGLRGLEHAQLQVQNQEQVQLMDQIMEKLQEQNRERLQLLDGLRLDIEGEGDDAKVIATGRKEARFLGLFTVRRMVQYNINDQGTMTRTRDLFDFLFTEEE